MIAPDGVLEVAGTRLEARFMDGPADRPVLVLLHEGLGSVSQWRDFPDLLATASGCAVLAYSRAGYGASAPVSLPRPLSYMHDEAGDVLPHIISQLQGRDHVLVGHSDGASIAAIYAGSKPHAGLKGLVLMAPHVFVEDISIAGIRTARDAWETTNLRDRLKRHHGDNVDTAFLGWNDSWLNPGFRDWDITGFLPLITAPVLAVQGRDDDYGTLAQLDAIEQSCGAPVTKLVLDDCGHAPQKDQTAAVLDAICSFVTEL
ncbi:alpha/beta fold hydrolase [Anderseniella sp. Alg231-50]|uniref:alpha/beta fold hydrolase n=1 Tax=Anderseniella sp. Alg231-50 TaxID=1922226 RepID=UPI000D55A7B7